MKATFEAILKGVLGLAVISSALVIKGCSMGNSQEILEKSTSLATSLAKGFGMQVTTASEDVAGGMSL